MDLNLQFVDQSEVTEDAKLVPESSFSDASDWERTPERRVRAERMAPPILECLLSRYVQHTFWESTRLAQSSCRVQPRLQGEHPWPAVS